MRRFRLQPISTPGGFAQTIVLPPAVRPPRERETPTPGDCTGVPDPPTEASVRGVITGEEICWTLLTAVPDGYTAEPSYCDRSENPGTWQLTRACDGAVFEVPVTSVEIVE